jgi:hypothetical protein
MGWSSPLIDQSVGQFLSQTRRRNLAFSASKNRHTTLITTSSSPLSLADLRYKGPNASVGTSALLPTFFPCGATRFLRGGSGSADSQALRHKKS